MCDLTGGLTAPEVVARAKAAGVLVTAWHQTRVRCVLHLDIDEAALARASMVLAEVLAA